LFCGASRKTNDLVFAAGAAKTTRAWFCGASRKTIDFVFAAKPQKQVHPFYT
jgi:hypothetical protein